MKGQLPEIAYQTPGESLSRMKQSNKTMASESSHSTRVPLTYGFTPNFVQHSTELKKSHLSKAHVQLIYDAEKDKLHDEIKELKR
jgi:hypothetical protein